MLHKMSSSGLDVDLFGNLFFGAASPLFGATAVLAMIQALSSKPQMVLSDEGIFDCNLKMGVLPWSEIAGAQVRQMLNQRNVEVQLRDPEQCRRRQPWRLLSGYSLAVGASPFILYTSYSNISADSVIDYISQQLRRLASAPLSFATPSETNFDASTDFN